MNCWEGYEENNVWDCDLTTLLAPPSPREIDVEEDRNPPTGTEAMFLYEKVYDALQPPLKNELNGTCQVGQLLLQGYEQEIMNGKNIRQAYLYNGQKFDHNPRMRLLDTSSSVNVWEDDQIYLRADDDQRTLMSGQVLLRGLLEPEIQAYFDKHHQYPVLSLHTADRGQDILDANERACPRLREIRERFYLSSEFQSFNASNEVKEIRKFQSETLKNQGDMDAIDCLGTTICTDRDLPASVNDFPKENGWFKRLFQFDTDDLGLLYKHNDAEYAKLAMGPLWNEILFNIDAFLDDVDMLCCPARKPAKLALFSAHDTTIMPLLVTLGVWDGQWAPYASMIALELHEVNIDGLGSKSIFRSNFAFRIVYNGQVLTSRVEGCTEDLELCDADVLIDKLRKFARRDIDCERQYDKKEEYTDTVSRAREVVSTPGGIIAFTVLVLGSGTIGAVLCYVCLTGSLPRKKKRTLRVDYDGIALTRQGNGIASSNGYHDEDAQAGIHNEQDPVLT